MWWHEWQRYADRHGLTVCRATLPGAVLGFLAEPGTIVVADWLPPEPCALVGWHEIGHLVLHPASCSQWGQLPTGTQVVWRLERQAWEFALRYPIWEDDALDTALRILRASGRMPRELRTVLSHLP